MHLNIELRLKNGGAYIYRNKCKPCIIDHYNCPGSPCPPSAQMPAHAMGCISEEQHCTWRIHPFYIEWYQACCLGRDVTHLSSLLTANTILRKEADRDQRLAVLAYRGRLSSGLMWIASPNRYLGYMKYFHFNV